MVCSGCSSTSSAPSASSSVSAASAAGSSSATISPRPPTSGCWPLASSAPHQRHALAQQFHTLDPIALARDIQQALDLLWKLADTRPRLQEAARG
jgi:hypothetical protein